VVQQLKQVYVCGDSFSTPDPEYGTVWVDLLQHKLGEDYSIVNTSSVAASNLLVAVQVDNAIKNRADFVVIVATACTRSEALVQPATDQALMTRFNRHELVSYSIFRPYRSHLNTQDQEAIYNFHLRYTDLELNIFRDHTLLLGTLTRLQQAGIPFLFDQGGFEHPSFGGSRRYFEQFDAQRSALNVWDYGTTQDERPYYHVKEPALHQQIADYYYTEITDYFDE
jgi:hypothetical protein